MYTAAVLLDVHARAHESFRRLILHCGTLPDDDLVRPIAGFGFQTVLRQLDHTVGAELYWQIVLTRGYHEEATLPDLTNLSSIDAFRRQVAATTRAYLKGASDEELNTPRRMVSDPGETRVLRPADVIMRIVTHVFHHQAQILSMSRILGKPNDTFDLDYSLEPLPVRTDQGVND